MKRRKEREGKGEKLSLRDKIEKLFDFNKRIVVQEVF